MASPPELTSSASELRIVLGQLVRRLRAENRMSISQATVLARLDRDGPATASNLAAAERVRPQSMAQTIVELETGGLVSRTPDETDRRQILVDLTEQGRAMLADDRARRDGWLAQAIETQLAADEQELLAKAIALLGRIASN